MDHQNAGQWLVDDLVKKWNNNKAYMLEALEAMPEESYDFVPAPGMMSFQEQAVHVANGFHFHWKAAGLSGLPEMKEGDKAAIMESYTRILDEVIASLPKLTGAVLSEEKSMWYGSSTKNRIFNLMDNHLAHHRGQMIVYLRLKGIKPPAYRGW